MFNSTRGGASRRILGLAAVTVGALALGACSSSNPLAADTASAGSSTIVVGSQAYYSNEIIAELYAEALEHAGYTVERKFQIGQRSVYLPELESGAVQVIPEYTGNLLQYYDKSTTATDPDSIAAALKTALPPKLAVLAAAAASDQDSYTTTKAFAAQWGLSSIADLSKVTSPLTVAANAEFATRPYGPTGLKSLYGVTATVSTVQDSGGPLTLKALVDGSVQLADLYTADPAIKTNDLVVLSDPKHLILPENVVPLVAKSLPGAAQKAIDSVQAKLSASQLIELNVESTVDQKSAAVIAKAWLKQEGITG